MKNRHDHLKSIEQSNKHRANSLKVHRASLCQYFFYFLLAKCYVVHWLTTRDYDLLLQTSEQVVIFRRDGFVASVGYSHNTTHL